MSNKKSFLFGLCILLCLSLLFGCKKTEQRQEESIKQSETTTQAASTKAITERTAPKSNISSFSKEDIKNLNTFLSNFAEVSLNSYSSKNSDNYTLVYFAFAHNKINTTKIKYENGNAYMEYSDVNETAKKYFGKQIEKRSENEYTFKNNRFYVPAADGESNAYVAIATGFIEKDGGEIEVPFKVFSYKEPHPSKDEYDAAFPAAYASTYEEISKNSIWIFESDGTATVKRKTYNGKNTYELLEYKILN